jgi:hypothetical protein
MISRADALMLRGFDVSVTYRRPNGAILTRTGTLKGVYKSLLIEAPVSGRYYHIPLMQVMAVQPLDPLTVHNFLQDGMGAALSSQEEVIE